jgi:4-azaleucine resistance transporter AzlC
LKPNQFREGLKAGSPIAIGYLPYGLAYGLVAKAAGFNLFQTLLMSATVYAGTAQFIAVAMIAAGQPALSIMFTVLLVNSRYLLMNSALMPAMKGWRKISRLAVSYYVSDETFVVLSNQADKVKLTESFSFGVNAIALFGWLVSNTVGYVAGNYFDLKRFGFDFALIAVLVALAVLMIKSRASILVGVAAGILTVVLHFCGLVKVSILLAAIIASTFGVLSTWKRTKSV